MNNLKRTRIINNVEQKQLVQPITYDVVPLNKFKKKGKINNILFRDACL